MSQRNIRKSYSSRSRSQLIDDTGVWVDGRLVWRNPTPGRYTGGITQTDGKVWIAGVLVYDEDSEVKEYPVPYELQSPQLAVDSWFWVKMTVAVLIGILLLWA